MKVAIIGSRSFREGLTLAKAMNTLADEITIDLVVSGGAQGADTLGVAWAKRRGIPTKVFLPDWAKYGKSAGFVRNHDIINEADLVVAFWDGKSKGTAHSIQLAKSQGKQVIILP